MKALLIAMGCCALVFVTQAILAFLESRQIGVLREEQEETLERLSSLRAEEDMEKYTPKDLEIALSEWKGWTALAKEQSLFWKEFLNHEENAHLNHQQKSSSTINTEISRFLSQLSRLCEQEKVKFGVGAFNPSPFLDDAPEPPKFGFGFSGYDGFWPSFDKEEANKLAIQAKIIKSLVEYLLNSYDETETLHLLSIKRESVGETDAKHIKDDLLILQQEEMLLRREGFVGSYVFETSFAGKTRNARSFVNQLRPPFSLRSIRVSRQNEDKGAAGGFFSANKSSDQEILPIIRDITSIFTMQVEYVFFADADLKTHLSQRIPRIITDAEKAGLFSDLQ